MYVQIGVWGSKRLAQFIMERSYPQNWLYGVDEHTKKKIGGLHPVSIKADFKEQIGSIMPKILRYYDIPDTSTLSIQPRFDLSPYKLRMTEYLEPYLDEEIGADSRFADHEEIEVYPCLSHQRSDYFTTHNLYSDYASEDFLRLINRQLQNYDSSECYMTHIRAYDPNFDICYQRISVKNPEALKDKVCDYPCEIRQSWLGQLQTGYAVYDLERELGEGAMEDAGFCDPEATLTPIEINKLIKAGIVDKELISKIQLYHNILWQEAFDPNHVSFMHDLLGYRFNQNYHITHSNQVQLLDFDWDSLA